MKFWDHNRNNKRTMAMKTTIIPTMNNISNNNKNKTRMTMMEQ